MRPLHSCPREPWTLHAFMEITRDFQHRCSFFIGKLRPFLDVLHSALVETCHRQGIRLESAGQLSKRRASPQPPRKGLAAIEGQWVMNCRFQRFRDRPQQSSAGSADRWVHKLKVDLRDPSRLTMSGRVPRWSQPDHCWSRCSSRTLARGSRSVRKSPSRASAGSARSRDSSVHTYTTDPPNTICNTD